MGLGEGGGVVGRESDAVLCFPLPMGICYKKCPRGGMGIKSVFLSVRSQITFPFGS